MKEKIIYLVIGVLIGAIITTGCFMIFNHSKRSKQLQGRPGQMQMEKKDSNFQTEKSTNKSKNSTTNTDQQKKEVKTTEMSNGEKTDKKPLTKPEGEVKE